MSSTRPWTSSNETTPESCLHSAAWAGRIAALERISGAALMPTTADCVFGDRFTTDLLVFRIQALGVCDEG